MLPFLGVKKMLSDYELTDITYWLQSSSDFYKQVVIPLTKATNKKLLKGEKFDEERFVERLQNSIRDFLRRDYISRAYYEMGVRPIDRRKIAKTLLEHYRSHLELT